MIVLCNRPILLVGRCAADGMKRDSRASHSSFAGDMAAMLQSSRCPVFIIGVLRYSVKANALVAGRMENQPGTPLNRRLPHLTITAKTLIVLLVFINVEYTPVGRFECYLVFRRS